LKSIKGFYQTDIGLANHSTGVDI